MRFCTVSKTRAQRETPCKVRTLCTNSYRQTDRQTVCKGRFQDTCGCFTASPLRDTVHSCREGKARRTSTFGAAVVPVVDADKNLDSSPLRQSGERPEEEERPAER